MWPLLHEFPDLTISTVDMLEHRVRDLQAVRDGGIARLSTKRWATSHFGSIADLLDNRYLMYGEWLFAKHTIFYDRLTHYFQEFDILDRETNEFLSTKRRREMLLDSPIASVSPQSHRGD